MSLHTLRVCDIPLLERKYRTDVAIKVDLQHGAILYGEDVVDPSLARAVREFARKISFDPNRARINDTDNLVQDHVYRQLQEKWKMTDPANWTDETCKTNDAIVHNPDDVVADPTHWIWERFSHDIWRAAPLTAEDFYNSPIYGLVETLQWLWWNWLPDKSMYSTCWVLQRIPTGKTIGKHTDDNGERRLAFVYYLTDDDWAEEDGGILHAEVKSKVHKFIPKFNSIVGWRIKIPTDQSAPDAIPHWVNPVLAPNDKPRLALVGFWC